MNYKIDTYTYIYYEVIIILNCLLGFLSVING